MVKITKCPPGKADGADDLQIWARQRNAGLSGVPDDRYRERRPHKQKLSPERSLRQIREMARDPWFSRLVAAGCKLDPENLQLAVRLLETLFRHLEVHKTCPSSEFLGQLCH